ncbi:MAG: TRAP transporter large permease [Xanthobacteraceae bacterium]|jgi:C4-dicarboxylate transporter, DctM subunit
MAALALICLPLALLCLGVPIFAALIAAAAVGIIGLGIGSIEPVHVALFGGLDNFPLLAVPLFIFAGEMMGRGGIARRLVEWVLAVVGGVRGSLALATVASSELFGSMSGSSVGCVAAIGRLMIPELTKRGYTAVFSGSLIASCGAIATIIPPSITMIIYGVAAQESVPKLFLAGIVPGLLIGLLVAIYLMIYARIEMIPLTASLRWKNVWQSTGEAVWALFAPVVILGGIYGGIFTPTEAAGVACIYAVLVARFVYREMTWLDVWFTAIDSAKVISQILIIVSAAGAYSWVVTTSGFPARLVAAIAGLQVETWVLLLIINVVLLLVGTVLEPPAAILILTPLLIPLITQAGVDHIHFGIIFTVNLAVGMFIPPFGLNLFATHALFGIPLARLYRGVQPFIVIYLIALALITYVPAITLAPLKLWR